MHPYLLITMTKHGKYEVRGYQMQDVADAECTKARADPKMYDATVVQPY